MILEFFLNCLHDSFSTGIVYNNGMEIKTHLQPQKVAFYMENNLCVDAPFTRNGKCGWYSKAWYWCVYY